MLVKRFNASYTASKGALEEAWKMFNMYRDWLATDFCQPVYEEWLTEAVAKGRIKAPGFFTDAVIRKAYCTAKWNGPAKGMLDPVKEVTAAEKRVQNGFSTRSDETMQMTGSGYYSNVEQLKHEEKELREVRKIANGNADDPATGYRATHTGSQQINSGISFRQQATSHQNCFCMEQSAVSSHGGKTG